MEKISISLTDEQIHHIKELMEKQGEGRSEAVRTLVERGRNYSELEEEVKAKVEEVERKREEEIKDLEQEIERLHRERRQLLEQREENQELVRFAEEQRSVVHEQREEERRRRSANMFRRAWWFVAGEPDPEAVDG